MPILSEHAEPTPPPSSAPLGSSAPDTPASNAGETSSASPEPAPPELASARVRGRPTLPASPVERAKLEAARAQPANELHDRSTQVAFGLLFVLPLFIILAAILFLIPFINAQLTQEPSGAQVQTAPNLPANAQR